MGAGAAATEHTEGLSAATAGAAPPSCQGGKPKGVCALKDPKFRVVVAEEPALKNFKLRC